MAINSKTHISISVVVSKEIEKKLNEKAKENNRSRSAQVLTYIQEGLKKDNKYL